MSKADVFAQALALAPDERMELISLLAEADAQNENSALAEAAVRRGLDDLRQGRLAAHAEVMARLRAQFPAYF